MEGSTAALEAKMTSDFTWKKYDNFNIVTNTEVHTNSARKQVKKY